MFEEFFTSTFWAISFVLSVNPFLFNNVNPAAFFIKYNLSLPVYPKPTTFCPFLTAALDAFTSSLRISVTSKLSRVFDLLSVACFCGIMYGMENIQSWGSFRGGVNSLSLRQRWSLHHRSLHTAPELGPAGTITASCQGRSPSSGTRHRSALLSCKTTWI